MQQLEQKENEHFQPKSSNPVQERPPLQSIRLSTCNAQVVLRRSSPVHDYSHEIVQHLRNEQSTVPPTYMTSQPDLTHKMRAITVDWLVSVHDRFKLQSETLFLTVSLLDRFLSKSAVRRQDLQLAGVASLFLAAKYEEIYPPALRDIVYLTDKAYTQGQVVQMERKLLAALGYDLTQPSAWWFFNWLSSDLTAKATSLGKYLLELSLVEYHMLKHEPGLLAVTACFLSKKIFNRDYLLGVPQLQYTDSQVKQCAKEMLVLFQAAPRHPLKAVYQKYAQPVCFQVAKIRLT